MPTARQYRLYDPERGRVLTSTAPTFTENRRLLWDWKEEVIGDEITPFDPMEPVEPEPEAPEDPEAPVHTPKGSPVVTPPKGSSTVKALQPPPKGNLTVSLPFDTEEELEGDTIVVDTGARSPETTESGPEPQEGRYATRSSSRSLERGLQATESPEGQIPLPKTYAEAVNDPIHSGDWKQAISEELTKLQALETWEHAELPPGKKALGFTWVFTVKYTPTGLIDRYKARLVAQGFGQVSGDNYLETFSPAIRAESLRLLLALGAYEDLEIRQIDVVSAYPRSTLHATVYMRAPEALKVPKGQVLLVKKSLYGLKQSGREWYIEACKGLETLGFTPCFSEPSVLRNPESGILIGLYVDDMLILGPKPQAIEKVVQGIRALWEIKDLGNVGKILGSRVRRNRQNRTLYLDQEAYITEVISRFRLQEAAPVTLPVGDRNTLIRGRPDELQADQALYQSAIGALTWITKSSRPDIAYAVGQLSQHCIDPKIRHWNAVLRVLRYLKGTAGYRISYGPKGPNSGTTGAVDWKLQGYSDADYAGDTTDRHSVSGQLWCLNRGPITWNSTKQRSVALSTTESEYIALSEACKQGQWLRALLRELQRPQYLNDTLATPIFSDNQACIALAKDPVAHSRTKHIDVRYHYIRQLITYGKATVAYLPTGGMIADMLTKPLPITAYRRCIKELIAL
jgi:hypothetical protein